VTKTGKVVGDVQVHDQAEQLNPELPPESAAERVHMDHPDAPRILGEAIAEFAQPLAATADALVVLCIGTDRSIGDALGPLIGSALQDCPGPVKVLGTLDEPVHAGNLACTVEQVQAAYRRPFIIAVDACLGREESVGTLTVGRGTLRPGAGVNKTLPPVGDIFLHGVVNVGGFMEYFVLQNTRLGFVYRMARVAAAGIQVGLQKVLPPGRRPRE